MLAAIAEVMTGLALVFFLSLVGQLLLGQYLVGAATMVARVTGIALFPLGLARSAVAGHAGL